MNEKPPRILMIEDDRTISELVAFNLKKNSFDPVLASDGQTGLNMALKLDFDIVLCDIMLPGLDGITLCKKLREQKNIPVIMLTAKGGETDKLSAFETGADDYIVKPFSIAELIMRIKANLRRSRGEFQRKKTLLTLRDLVIDTEICEVRKNGELLDISGKEYALLVFFFKNPNKVFSREKLLNLVWGYSYSAEGERTVDVTISRLRKKIEENPDTPLYILTKRGEGYYLKNTEQDN